MAHLCPIHSRPVNRIRPVSSVDKHSRTLNEYVHVQFVGIYGYGNEPLSNLLLC
jgi:hypothetical protein